MRLDHHCPVQAKHRRIRRWDGLWAVYDASLRWRALQRRRQQREVRYQESLQAAGEVDRDAIQSALSALQKATSLEVLTCFFLLVRSDSCTLAGHPINSTKHPVAIWALGNHASASRMWQGQALMAGKYFALYAICCLEGAAMSFVLLHLVMPKPCARCIGSG